MRAGAGDHFAATLGVGCRLGWAPSSQLGGRSMACAAPARAPPQAPCRGWATRRAGSHAWRAFTTPRSSSGSNTTTSSSTEAAAASGSGGTSSSGAGAAARQAGRDASPPVGSTQLELTVSLASGTQHVGREEWDACATAGAELNPFVLHDFLHALEASKSAVRDEGWLAQHVLVRDGGSGELLGCCPMYLKGHSYGEYIFDNSWANAYQRMLAKPYYPKLLVGVPFTPVPGPRLLVKPGPHAAAVRRALADCLKQVADQMGVSSLHINFASAEEYEELGTAHSYLQRTGIQYHWYNQDVSRSLLGSSSGSSSDEGEADTEAAPPSSSVMYSSFDEGEGSFLMSLRQSKRKSIRQERKKAAQEGLRFMRLTGDDIKPHHWDSFYQFYRNTTDRKWGTAYLTRSFFSELGERMGDRVLLVLAETADGGAPGHGRPVAGALNLIGSHALFGRNWGCIYGDRVPNLHFELCYYQALEFAIERGLQRVEAGAQGEHKLQRGYIPSLTYSAHYIPDPNFSGVVERYLHQERAEIDYTLSMLRQEASPYKQL